MQNLGVILRLHEVGLPRPRRQRDGRRDPRAHPRGARLRARGAEPEDARAHLQGPPVHRHPRRRHEPLAREGRRHRVRRTAAGSRSSSSSRRTSATGSARSSTASTSGACTATAQFSGDPHPGNSMLLDDGRMAFLDFGLFKRIRKEVADSELRIGARGHRGGRRRAARASSSTAGFIADPDGRGRRGAARPVPRPDVVVHGGRGGRR